jgi:uracil-DNA glycosylase family 4
MRSETKILGEVHMMLKFYEALGFECIPLHLKRNAVCKLEKTQGGGAAPVHTADNSSGAKRYALNALVEEIGHCQRCRLSKGRTHIVFGEGNADAAIMFIGEAPGKEEDLQARPFVGDAGRLLTRLIDKMGFRREEVYIGNIVKCRPPSNRDPEGDEIMTCLPFIERQVEIIAPKVIVSLGRISAQALTGTKIPISRLRGSFCEYQGIPLMPTFHPAYLLRNPKDKWLVWEDAQKVLGMLKLP